MANAETIKDRVARVLATEVAPALRMDGADLEVVDVADGVARVRFHGVCMSCPSTAMAILMGMEQALRQHVPEVEIIEPTA